MPARRARRPPQQSLTPSERGRPPSLRQRPVRIRGWHSPWMNGPSAGCVAIVSHGNGCAPTSTKPHFRKVRSADYLPTPSRGGTRGAASMDAHHAFAIPGMMLAIDVEPRDSHRRAAWRATDWERKSHAPPAREASRRPRPRSRVVLRLADVLRIHARARTFIARRRRRTCGADREASAWRDGASDNSSVRRDRTSRRRYRSCRGGSACALRGRGILPALAHRRSPTIARRRRVADGLASDVVAMTDVDWVLCRPSPR